MNDLLNSSTAIRVAIMRLADPELPLEDSIHFLNELIQHGQKISEIAQIKLESLTGVAMTATGDFDGTDFHLHSALEALRQRGR